MYHECNLNVTWMYRECNLNVSRMSPECECARNFNLGTTSTPDRELKFGTIFSKIARKQCLHACDLFHVWSRPFWNSSNNMPISLLKCSIIVFISSRYRQYWIIFENSIWYWIKLFNIVKYLNVSNYIKTPLAIQARSSCF